MLTLINLPNFCLLNFKLIHSLHSYPTQQIHIWQEAFETCSLGSKPRFLCVARLECDSVTNSASWIRPIYPRPYSSKGCSDLDTRWICPPGLCPWRSSDTPLNRRNNDGIADRRDILAPRFAGPDCERMNDFVVTLSCDGTIRVWSVRGLQISTSGLRDSVQAVEVANAVVSPHDILSKTVSIAFAPISKMCHANDAPNHLSVLLAGTFLPFLFVIICSLTHSFTNSLTHSLSLSLIHTGNFPSCIQLRLSSNRVLQNTTLSVLGGLFDSDSSYEMSSFDEKGLVLVSSSSLQWYLFTGEEQQEERNHIVKENIHTMSTLTNSNNSTNILLAIVMKSTKLLRLLQFTTKEKRWSDVGFPVQMSLLPICVVACRNGQHVAGFDQTQLWYRCVVDKTLTTIPVQDICSIADGNTDMCCCVLTGHRNGDVKLWKSSNNKLIVSQTLKMSGEIQHIRCNPVSGRVCAASSETVCIWDTLFCASRLCGDEKSERGKYALARREAVLKVQPKHIDWIHTSHNMTYLAVSNCNGLKLFARRDQGIWKEICTYDPTRELATMHTVQHGRLVIDDEEEEEETKKKYTSRTTTTTLSVANFCSVKDEIAILIRVGKSDAMEIHRVRVVDSFQEQLRRQKPCSLVNSILEATRAGRCNLTTKLLESLHCSLERRERRKTEENLLRFNTKHDTTVKKEPNVDLSVAEKLRHIRNSSWTISSSQRRRKNVFDDIDEDLFDLNRLCDIISSHTSNLELVSLVRALSSYSTTLLSNNEEEASFRFRFACSLRLHAQVSKRTHNSNGLVETEVLEGSIRGALESRHIAWAMLSNFQPTLLREHFLDPIPLEKPQGGIENVTSTWERARSVGLPLWIQSPALLWKAATSLARSEFLIGQKQRNPWRAAPFYVAMKKCRVLSTPFQRFGQKRVADFFQRDFTVKANRDAALKNAYKLLRKLHMFLIVKILLCISFRTLTLSHTQIRTYRYSKIHRSCNVLYARRSGKTYVHDGLCETSQRSSFGTFSASTVRG